MKGYTKIAVILAIAGYALGYMIANPTELTEYKRLSLSMDYSHDTRKIGYKNSPDLFNRSDRVLVKFNYSFYKIPHIEGYALIGAADVNVPSSNSYQTDFNGDWTPAFGAGVRADIYPFELGALGIALRANAGFLTTQSNGIVEQGQNLEWEIKYRWNEYPVSIYATFDVQNTAFGSPTAWAQFKPYIGIEWLYIDAVVRRKVFLSSDSTRQELSSDKSFFNDPFQWPKPVIGFDIKLPNGYTLSTELVFWLKQGSCIRVGVSQMPHSSSASND